jgi:iron complex outermembrane receptor protein
MDHPSQRRVAYPLLPLALVAATAGAQEAPSPANALDEIIVTATLLDRTVDDVPAAVSVISQDDIQLARQQLALDEALSRVPGVFMQNRYNFAQDLRVSIRGFGARAQFGIRGIKVLVDGIPETLPDGQGSVDSLDLGASSQIEVIRGPSSSLYGNASGGVISVISESGTAEPFAELRVSGGDYDFQKVQFKTGGETDRLGYLVSLSDSEIQGYRGQSEAKNTLFTSRFDLDLGKDRNLLTVLNYTDQPVSDDAGALPEVVTATPDACGNVLTNPRSPWCGNVQFDAGESLEQTRLGFVYSTPVGQNGSIKARNYYAWREFGNLLPGIVNAPTLLSGIVDLERTFIGGGVSYTYDGFWLDRPNRLIAGLDFDDQDDDRRRYNNVRGVQGALGFDQNEHVTSHGVFLQNELSVTEAMRITFGVRFDEVEFEITDRFLTDGINDSGSLNFDDTSPMLGLVVDLTPNLNLYATYSSAFETPTTTELNKPDLSGGFNANLVPQVATNLETGLRGRVGDKNRYEISLFTIDVEDELIPFAVPGSPGRNYYQNAGESTRDGVEFSWVANPTDTLRTTVSYTYSDFTFTEFVDAAGVSYAGKVIPGTSENLLFGEIEYRHPKGWFAAADVLYTDDQYGDNANAFLIPGYTIANLRLGYDAQLGDFFVSPFLGVNNLTDESYAANVRLNPANCTAANRAAATCRFREPGPTRNAYAGVTVGWKFR